MCCVRCVLFGLTPSLQTEQKKCSPTPTSSSSLTATKHLRSTQTENLQRHRKRKSSAPPLLHSCRRYRAQHAWLRLSTLSRTLVTCTVQHTFHAPHSLTMMSNQCTAQQAARSLSQFPLSRIKKIIRMDRDIKFVNQDAMVAISKATVTLSSFSFSFPFHSLFLFPFPFPFHPPI